MNESQRNIFDEIENSKKLSFPDVINLNENGVSLYRAHLSLQDYLWFSSSEISKVSTTIPVIHNYALSYALNQFSYALFIGNTPKYEEDFKENFKCYSTPAISFASRRESFTYNALNDLKQTPGQTKINSPNFGYKTVIVPNYISEDKKESLYAFKFFIFCWKNEPLPSVIRLGKKSAVCRVYYEQIEKPIARFLKAKNSLHHPVNPLDVSGKIERGDLVRIPPHSFYRVATISSDWFIKGKTYNIHFPKRIMERIYDN